MTSVVLSHIGTRVTPTTILLTHTGMPIMMMMMMMMMMV
jgi:hypothetical protein